MGKIIIQNETTENPLTLMGKEAGICWGSDTTDDEKNLKRGINCIKSGHGRVLEYPQVYMIIDGYSARFVRELYTHIAGGPSRLQASTRYIDYAKEGFKYVIPLSVKRNPATVEKYIQLMSDLNDGLKELEKMGVTKEDVAMGLPLGMKTKVVMRTNLRHLIDMAHQRLCTRAYWEYREFMADLMLALSAYSAEWAVVVEDYFKAKCTEVGYCMEAKGCGKYPSKEEFVRDYWKGKEITRIENKEKI